MIALIGIVWILLQMWLTLKIMKWGAALLVVGLALALCEEAVDAFVNLLESLVDPVINDVTFPIVGMLRYMGIVEGISVVLGAHLAVFSLRTVYRLVGWI